jgi:hypothetical protein
MHGLVVRDARRRRAPHHEGLGPHPEEARSAVSKDEATVLENALAHVPRGTFACSHRYLRGRGGALQMSKTYIIEVGSETAGIVVRNLEGYRFFAATRRFNALEGQLFRSAREAERTAVRFANGNLKRAA